MKKGDERLLQRLQQGERSAMEEFYRSLSPYLFAVCRRYLSDAEDAKDVLQESFIKMFSQVDRFKPKEDGSLRSWATRIVVNSSLNFLRDRQQLFVSVEERIVGDIPDEEIQAERLPAEVVQQLIEQLPVGYRTVFNLFAIEQMSHKQIARLLGISESTSASQYHRAKRLLKAKISQYLKEE